MAAPVATNVAAPGTVIGEVAAFTISTVAVTDASQKKRALTAWAMRSARLMDGGQTLGGDTSGTCRTDAVSTNSVEEAALTSGFKEAVGTSNSGAGTVGSTSSGAGPADERRRGARSGAGAARGRCGLMIVAAARGGLTGDHPGGDQPRRRGLEAGRGAAFSPR